ncbi:target of rapamycin complex subunit lst8-like [Watersipora subatra]|uniref:target of rapamycin complex subunit lst8-like n=1 Tax=Watersipora subatra TaxID=2589382 RepID=UPI00355B9504
MTSDNVILATGGYDHSIRFWKPHSGLCKKTLQHLDSPVNDLAITPDRQSIASAGYQQIRVFDINSSNPNPVTKYEDISKNITAIGFNEEGSWMYSSGEDHAARIWDRRARGNACQRTLQTKAAINCACLHPNQAELFVGDQSGAIHIWDLKSERTEQYVPDASSGIQSISVDAEGTHMAAVTDKGVCFIWHLTQGRGSGELTQPHPKEKLTAHRKYALKCLFSPDSTLLATTSADGTIRIWKTIDFSKVAELSLGAENSKLWVWDCAFSDDSTYIISGSSDNFARLWCIDTGKVEKEFAGHTKAITSLAFKES